MSSHDYCVLKTLPWSTATNVLRTFPGWQIHSYSTCWDEVTHGHYAYWHGKTGTLNSAKITNIPYPEACMSSMYHKYWENPVVQDSLWYLRLISQSVVEGSNVSQWCVTNVSQYEASLWCHRERTQRTVPTQPTLLGLCTGYNPPQSLSASPCLPLSLQPWNQTETVTVVKQRDLMHHSD
jgi:hypothetical protein